MKILLLLILISNSAFSMSYRMGDQESKNVVDKRHPIYSLNNNEIAEVCERGFLPGWFSSTVYSEADQTRAKEETRERIWNLKMHSSQQLSDEMIVWKRSIAKFGFETSSDQSKVCRILKTAIAAWDALCACGDERVRAECRALQIWHLEESRKWRSHGLDDRCFWAHQYRP